jgi:drug/metabolite transporter (DMT)-like permease
MTSRAVRRWSPHTSGLLIVGSGVVILSFDSLLIRLLARSLPFIDVLFWRGVGGAIGFSLIAWLVSPRGVWRAFRIIGTDGLLIAVLYSLGNATFVTSVTHTTVAHALVIIAAAPMATAILAHLILREKASRRTWVVSIVVAIGVCLVFWAVPSRGDLVGDLAAVGGALVLSLNLVVLRKARLVSMIPAYAIGGALTALFSAPYVTRFSLSPREVAFATLVGVVVLPISLSLIMRGPRYLHAPDVSLLMLLETVPGPMWVLLAFREVPDVQTLISGSMILGALAVNTLGPWARIGTAAPVSSAQVASQPDHARGATEQVDQ